MKPVDTTDPQEIARFNQLAAIWWNPDGPMWPLHLLNQFRVKLILEVLAERGRIDPSRPSPLADFTVLDIGCGGGILSEALARLGAQVTGIDMADNSIAIAREHATKTGLDIDYHCREVGDLDGEFDLVFNMEVVEHVAHLQSFMAASCQRVKPQGMMFLSTINRTLKSYLFAILGAEYILRLLPRGTHQWSRFVPPAALQEQLRPHGLDTVWQTGVSLNPFTKTYSSVSSMAVNYMLAADKNGTGSNGSDSGNYS